MNNVFLFFSLLFTTSFIAHSTVVTIPDTNFKDALIAVGVDTNQDSLIQESEALVITHLDVHSKSIIDLTGIEAFTNLTTLRCDTNSIEVLDISALQMLDTLECQSNNIKTLDISTNLTLTKVNCALNKLTSFDLSKNTAMLWFDIGGNTIMELDVSQNINLILLDIVYCGKLAYVDLMSNVNLESVLAIWNPQLLKICVSVEVETSTWWLDNNTEVVVDCVAGIDDNTNSQTITLLYTSDLLGNKLDDNSSYSGIKFERYSDGSTRKVYQVN